MELIRECEIPKSCRECKRNRKCPQWNRRSLWKQEYVFVRSESCPLKSVEGLIEKIEGSKFYVNDDEEYCEPYKSICYYTNEALDTAIKIIKEYCEAEL